MAMIEGYDYVTIRSWTCPHCNKHHTFVNTTIGRYPHSSKLFCQNCAEYCLPANAKDVTYV